MKEMKKLNLESLTDVTGGNVGAEPYEWVPAVAKLKMGYLAIRNYPSYDDSNIIGKIPNGSKFKICPGMTSHGYVWAEFNGIQGWVNQDYAVTTS